MPYISKSAWGNERHSKLNNPQESAGCSCPVSGSWETKSLHVKQTGEGTFRKKSLAQELFQTKKKWLETYLLHEQDAEVMTYALIHSTSRSSQGSDRQHQPAHQHVHPAGARPEGVWQCPAGIGGGPWQAKWGWSWGKRSWLRAVRGRLGSQFTTTHPFPHPTDGPGTPRKPSPAHQRHVLLWLSGQRHGKLKGRFTQSPPKEGRGSEDEPARGCPLPLRTRSNSPDTLCSPGAGWGHDRHLPKCQERKLAGVWGGCRHSLQGPLRLHRGGCTGYPPGIVPGTPLLSLPALLAAWHTCAEDKVKLVKPAVWKMGIFPPPKVEVFASKHRTPTVLITVTAEPGCFQ